MRAIANAVLLTSAAVLAAACGSDGPTGPGDPEPVATVVITPDSTDVAVGTTVGLSAATRSASGSTLTGRTVAWSSSSASTATVSSTGTVTAVAEGKATITATSEGRSGTAVVVVTAPPVTSVSVTPASPVIAVGTTTALAAETQIAGGQVVTGRVIDWSSSNTAVATVDATGTVTAIATGTATITAMSEGRSGSASLTVFLPFTQFGLGQVSSCALDETGAAYCWGGNGFGELGVGDLDERTAPTAVAGGHSFTRIGAGFNFACGLDDGGAARCWGNNTSGEVGSGSTADFFLVPTAVTGGLSFSQLAVGGGHTCGITDPAGELWCWGFNQFGQLGDGTTTNSNVPVQVTGGQTFASIGLGSFHTCGVTTAGDAYCWGRGTGGQIGDGTNDNASSGPVAVSGGLTFATIDGGQAHTCAWTDAGAGHCWGTNDFSQLGDGTTTSSTTPVAVTGGLAFTDPTTNGYLSCGTVAGGEVYCWGWNARGEMGDGTTTDRGAPTQPSGADDFVSVTAGFQRACALTAEGLAFCWGANDAAQLGDGTFNDRLTPTMVLPPE